MPLPPPPPPPHLFYLKVTMVKQLLFIFRQTQAGDEDSEWESATETETLEVRRRLQGRGFSADKRLGQDRVTSDGRLLINVDEDAEEIEEHQIPMKHQLEKTIASGCAKNNLSPSLVKKILRVRSVIHYLKAVLILIAKQKGVG